MALCGSQVCKVYIGSFNADKPIRTDVNPSGEDLFNKEQADLLQDLFEIPQRSCDRKVLSASSLNSVRSHIAPMQVNPGLFNLAVMLS